MARWVVSAWVITTTHARILDATRDSTCHLAAPPHGNATRAACIRAHQRHASVSTIAIHFCAVLNIRNILSFFANLPTFFIFILFPAVICATMSLTNGRVSGQCSGNYNDTCMYEECFEGFNMSETGNFVRTCNQSGFYSGSAKVCNRKFLGRKLSSTNFFFQLFFF